MIFPLFETICIEQGMVRNITLHQQRYEKSLSLFYSGTAVKIHDLWQIIAENSQFYTALDNPLIRCRIAYNHQHYAVQFFPYQRKIYRYFQPVICDDIDYSLKYQDRSLLNQLVKQKGQADEIMIIKKGHVTDCSIGNLVFRQGKDWFTPNTPLLKGTQREFLLQQGRLQEIPILAEDVHQFDEIRLINAMNSLD